jgi:hypothetical protein
MSQTKVKRQDKGFSVTVPALSINPVPDGAIRVGPVALSVFMEPRKLIINPEISSMNFRTSMTKSRSPPPRIGSPSFRLRTSTMKF